MTKSDLINHFSKANPVQPLLSLIEVEIPKSFFIKGLVGSSKSLYALQLFNTSDRPLVFISKDKETASYHLNELEEFIGKDQVLFYPGSYRRPYEIEETDNANVLLRAEVLNRLNSRKKPAIIVTYPNALFEKVVTKSELKRNTLKISVGDKLDLDFVNQTRFEYEGKRVELVTDP